MGEEHINSNDFDLSVKGFEKNVDVLNEMKKNNFQVIYLPFRWASFVERLRLLRVESTALKRQLSLIVVDERLAKHWSDINLKLSVYFEFVLGCFLL